MANAQMHGKRRSAQLEHDSCVRVEGFSCGSGLCPIVHTQAMLGM